MDLPGCQQLWRSVLAVALRDIFLPSVNRRTRTSKERDEAVAWVGSKEFHMVCALAGVDGPRMATRIRKRMKDRDAGTWNPLDIPYFRSSQLAKHEGRPRR